MKIMYKIPRNSKWGAQCFKTKLLLILQQLNIFVFSFFPATQIYNTLRLTKTILIVDVCCGLYTVCKTNLWNDKQLIVTILLKLASTIPNNLPILYGMDIIKNTRVIV